MIFMSDRAEAEKQGFGRGAVMLDNQDFDWLWGIKGTWDPFLSFRT